MKIGVLTSSRADYGIYLPLLQKIKTDPFFETEIVAFGMHLSKLYGYTINDIKRDKYKVVHEIDSLVEGDDEPAITTSYGNTILKFAQFWNNHRYDWVLCLGDRFEMSAAVQAGIPFRVKFAHLHGGETTTGAIDNIYRHQITLAAELHFTSTESYKKKVETLTGSSENVHSVGSLSLDYLDEFVPVDHAAFYDNFSLPEGDFVLVTFHPETISPSDNNNYLREIKVALEQLSKEIHLVITMPNADTNGLVYRSLFAQMKSEQPDKITLVENFGKVNYFSAMTYSRLLIGNSSSGIIEAASFGRFVVNVGKRQDGRAQSDNVLNCGFKAAEIIATTHKALTSGVYTGENIYYCQHVADAIVKIFKNRV
jgi:GDP/UDP-N,N'-diacetylbacillosamine 2-epimerase (hydrolysing)